MAVEFPVNVYGLTRQYERIKIASAVIIADANPVGGTIFYIDDTADGEYQFFDANGNTIENVDVGDKPYAYKVVTPGSKDKYYVYHDELYWGNWTYYKDGTYVYEYLGTSEGIGSGKTNTETVMARDNGAYIAADSNGIPTIWYQLQQTRLAKVGNCDDWFIPSRDEAEELRKAIGFQVTSEKDGPVTLPAGKVTGGVIAGTADGQLHYEQRIDDKYVCYPSATRFLNNNMWSSSENTFGADEARAYHWLISSQGWLADNGAYSKEDGLSIFFIRAF